MAEEIEGSFMEQYVKELQAPLPEEAYEEDGAYMYEYSHPGMYVDRVSIKHFKDNERDKYVLGSKHAALMRSERIRFSMIIEEYSDYEGVDIVLGGKKFVYQLYFDGIYRGRMMVIAIPGINRCDVPAESLGGQLFYMLDAGFDPYPLCEASTMSALQNMADYADNPLCYWDNLSIPKEHRGKGFAEILMRNAMMEHGDRSMGGLGQDVFFLSAWESRPVSLREKNSKKQDALNTFYSKFLEQHGFEFEMLERNGFIATNN